MLTHFHFNNCSNGCVMWKGFPSDSVELYGALQLIVWLVFCSRLPLFQPHQEVLFIENLRCHGRVYSLPTKRSIYTCLSTPTCLSSVLLSLCPYCQYWLLSTAVRVRRQWIFRVSLHGGKINANPVDSKSMNPPRLYLVNCDHLAQRNFKNLNTPTKK